MTATITSLPRHRASATARSPSLLLASALVAAATAALALGACGPPAKGPTTGSPGSAAPADAGGPSQAEPPSGARVLLECDPAETQVVIDGDARGPASRYATEGGLVLPRGLHRFEFTHPGYKTYRIELILAAKPETLRVKLVPIKR
jgi:hypothetical protein